MEAERVATKEKEGEEKLPNVGGPPERATVTVVETSSIHEFLNNIM